MFGCSQNSFFIFQTTGFIFSYHCFKVSKLSVKCNLQVLPRQTCGLYTHTQFFHSYPDGFSKLLNNIEGGDLFFTILVNPVSTIEFMFGVVSLCGIKKKSFETVIRLTGHSSLWEQCLIQLTFYPQWDNSTDFLTLRPAI